MSPHAAQAVVIDIGDGSGNTTASGDFVDPFAHVGVRGSSTAVYLGNGVVLTAHHVGAGSVNLGGTSYSLLGGTTQRLHAPGSASLVDLTLFQIDTTGLTLGALARGTAVTGATVRMAGNGRDRETDETFWDIAGSTWTEVTPPPLADASGFQTVGSNTIRWGENTVEAGSGPLSGNTLTRKVDFDSGEAQAVTNDSGGGVFQFNGGTNTWDLVGITLSVGLFADQPGGAATAVFGNETYFADLSQYNDQIDAYIAAVPSPTTLGLTAVGAVVLMIRRRQQA